MWPRWLAVVVCTCALLQLGHLAAVPTQTQDTLVVARDEQETTPTPVDIMASESSIQPDEGPTTEEPSPPIKLTEMHVRSEVALRYAHTAVVTTVRNPARRAQEATFRVLLPETAFISGFVMILDGKSYKAYVKEKEEAKQIYADAVSQGVGAAHITAKARDSNHFTVSVNIEPNTTAVFNLTYEELLVRRNKVYNHAINLHPGALVPKMTVTVHIKEAQKITELRVPEIRTGNEIDATESDPQNSKAVIERGHDDREATITFTPDLDEQRRLMEVYAVKTKQSQGLAPRHKYWQPLDEDESKNSQADGVLGQFVVQYDVDRPKEGEILVNDGYFVHFFAPADLPPLNKHVVFVLDTSGSMMDRKIVQLREAMQTILGELNPGDYFSLVEFATSVKVYDLKEADLEPPKQQFSYYSWEEKPATLVPPSPATPENIARAKTIVSRLNANGGTNIASALNVAVELIHKGIGWKPVATTPAPAMNVTPSNDAPVAEALVETTEIAQNSTTVSDAPKTEVAQPDVTSQDEIKKLEPMIIFLTDGDPTVGETNPQRIINRLSEKNYGENKAAIFSLAFGEDADRKFLRKISLRNDGFMRHIYEAADAALQLRDLYRQLASPLLARLHFNYPKDQIKEGSLTKNSFRTYYAGSETVVAGRVADNTPEITPTIVAVCGVDDSFTKKKYEIFPKVPVAKPREGYLPLERVWAYLTVKQLLDEKDAEDAPADKDKEDTPEKKALQIALKYEFVTPLTSLVVVKPNATNAVDAESVDKQESDSPFGVPLAAYDIAHPGVPPQFAYKAAFSSAIGHVQSAQIASFSAGAPGGPLLANDAVAYEEPESEDYDGSSIQYAPASMSFGLGGPRSGAFLSRRGGRPASYLRPMPFVQNRMAYFPSQAKDLSLPDYDYDTMDSEVDNIVVDAARPAAAPAPLSTRVPSQPSPPTTSVPPPPPPSAVDSLLQRYPWVQEALKPGFDVISLDLNERNQTHAELELTRDAVAPKEASDAACARATDGAAGVCVYLSRCDAARTITLAQYKDTFCTVSNKFAGVCCPKAEVDVAKP